MRICIRRIMRTSRSRIISRRVRRRKKKRLVINQFFGGGLLCRICNLTVTNKISAESCVHRQNAAISVHIFTSHCQKKSEMRRFQMKTMTVNNNRYPQSYNYILYTAFFYYTHSCVWEGNISDLIIEIGSLHFQKENHFFHLASFLPDIQHNGLDTT